MKVRRKIVRACILASFAAISLLLLIAPARNSTAQTQTPRDVELQPDRPTGKRPALGERFALVIGVDDYEDEGRISKLEGAVNDAKALAQTLIDYGGFPRDHVVLLTSDQRPALQPKKDIILERLQTLSAMAAASGKNGLLFVYFAGHGKAPGSEPYLLPVDVKVPDYNGTAIRAAEIQDIIRKNRVEQVILIIDACRRDPLIGRSEEDDRLTKAYLRFSLANQNIKAFVTLYATGINQYAYEFDVGGKKRGYFSYELERGLRGVAANERGEVKLAKLIEHLKMEVPKRVLLGGRGREQTPYLDDVHGDNAQELVLAMVEPEPGTSPPTPSSVPAMPSVPASPLASYSFETISLDGKGHEVKRWRGQARYFTENLGDGVTLEMLQIPGGTFLMGEDRTFSTSESPQHPVIVPGFFMANMEITRGQWRAVMKLPKVNTNLFMLGDTNSERDNIPVDAISWEEAVEFCARLSRKTGRTYRLPTEAEWEYACRAKTTTPYHFGHTLNTNVANYKELPRGTSIVIGTEGALKPAGSFGLSNDFGLYDMHGNVSEWCLDPWHATYNGAPLDASDWERGGDMSLRVVRGGSYTSYLHTCRSANRDKLDKKQRYYGVGFRVVALGKEVSTIPPAAQPPAPSAAPLAAEVPRIANNDSKKTQAEDDYWNRIKDSRESAKFAEYLRRYPAGQYATIARKQMQLLASRIRAEALPPKVLPNTTIKTIVSSNIPEDADLAINSPAGTSYIGFTPSNGWVILRSRGFSASNLPQSAADKLDELYKRGEPVKKVVFAPAGGWVILVGENGYATSGVSPALNDRLAALNKAGETIKEVAFHPTAGWIVIAPKNIYWTTDLPSEFIEALLDLNDGGKAIHRIAFAPKNGWVIIYDNGSSWPFNIPQQAFEELRKMSAEKRILQDVAFDHKGGWVIISNNQ